jgi:mannose/fructose/N-acetylgalactosamine-specific phosphotransferase system component IID
MKKKLIVLSTVGLLAPVLAFAQTITTTCGSSQNTTIQRLICVIQGILNMIIPALITLAIVFFIWGVVSYVIAKDEEAKKRGKDIMIYGIIGLVVIVAVWGLVSVLTTTFGLNGTVAPSLPTVPVI